MKLLKTRRETLFQALAAAAISLFCVAATGCSGKKERTEDNKAPAVEASRLPMQYEDANLVFVSFDALQAAHVGCLGYGRDVTPTIDRFAAESFLFSNNYSVASWTVPSSMSWFTGVYPSEHGMTNKFAVFEPERKKLASLKEQAPQLTTLAEILRKNGYATGGFTGNAGVSGGFGYEQGFDTYYSPAARFGAFDESIPRALAWLRTVRRRKFFLFLHGYDVHGQSVPSGGYDYRFVDDAYDGRFVGSQQEQEALREEGLDRGRLNVRPADIHFWRAIYDEKIQRADERFAKFLAAFEEFGLLRNTLFVLTSDHGTEFFEHGRIDHGFTLYDEQLRTPLVIRLPGQRSGKTIDLRVSSIDLMPTILELLGAGAEPSGDPSLDSQLRGQSLTPAMRGEPAARDVFAETDYREYTFKRAIVSPDGWKLIHTLESQSDELYNLGDDPLEARNLAAVEPARVSQMKEKLFDHFRAIGHDLTGRPWRPGFNPVYGSEALAPRQ